MSRAEPRATVPLFQHSIHCCNCGHLVSATSATAVHDAYVAHMDTHHQPQAVAS